MTRTSIALSIVALLSGPILGQSAAPPPTFEIADVHVGARSSNPNMRGGVLRAGRYELRNATMVDLIRTAYGIDADRVLGGPSWLELDRFDVFAKAPPATSADTARLMLRTLLADRFKLVIHEDTRPLTAFALTVGSGKPKLKETAGEGAGCQGQPQPPEPGVIPMQVVVCRNMTMAALAEQLPRMANAYVTSRVLDSTGLKGSFDFEIRWTARGLLAQAGADGMSIFDALDKQLGLKLEQQKMPMAAMVVDSVSRQPTDNPPGVAALLAPPAAPEFEVADIKPSPEGAPGPMARILPTGQINVSAMPLKNLITLAWNINNDDLIAAPKWLESARFDIVARAFTGPAEAQPLDIEIVQAMLRKLLVDRFKMKTHTEDRPVSAYTLTAPRPRLTKADPATRTRCAEGPGADAKDPRDSMPILSRLVTCQNVSMSQLADRLQGLAPGYIRTPVADATGLEGSWNFSFNFSPAGQVGGAPAGGRGGNAGPAPGAAPADGALAAPTGALTLLEALDLQLGLKLEMRERPMPVLVIDQISEKPTDN